MDNPPRNRIEDLRLREREMQAEEALATLNQLEKRDELYAKLVGTLYTNFRRHQQERRSSTWMRTLPVQVGMGHC